MVLNLSFRFGAYNANDASQRKIAEQAKLNASLKTRKHMLGVPITAKKGNMAQSVNVSRQSNDSFMVSNVSGSTERNSGKSSQED